MIRRHLNPLQAIFDFYKSYGVVRMVGTSKNDVYAMSPVEYLNFMRDAKLIDTGYLKHFL